MNGWIYFWGNTFLGWHNHDPSNPNPESQFKYIDILPLKPRPPPIKSLLKLVLKAILAIVNPHQLYIYFIPVIIYNTIFTLKIPCVHIIKITAISRHIMLVVFTVSNKNRVRLQSAPHKFLRLAMMHYTRINLLFQSFFPRIQ